MEGNIIYTVKELSTDDIESIKILFLSVFTSEPWNDDWSDNSQLDLYMCDLIKQSNSLAYGIFDNTELIGASLGCIKHWYTGTEYCIDEFFIKTERQGNGVGKKFMEEIQLLIKKRGMSLMFLLTDRNVPAYNFYKRNGFNELETHVLFVKKI